MGYTLLDYSGEVTSEKAIEIMNEVGIQAINVLEDTTHVLLQDGYVIIMDPNEKGCEIYSTDLVKGWEADSIDKLPK